METDDIEAINALRQASLAVAKMRFRGNQTTQPCWCETPGFQCVGQPQCSQATQALKDLDRAKFMIEFREATKEIK